MHGNLLPSLHRYLVISAVGGRVMRVAVLARRGGAARQRASQSRPIITAPDGGRHEIVTVAYTMKNHENQHVIPMCNCGAS